MNTKQLTPQQHILQVSNLAGPIFLYVAITEKKTMTEKKTSHHYNGDVRTDIQPQILVVFGYFCHQWAFSCAESDFYWVSYTVFLLFSSSLLHFLLSAFHKASSNANEPCLNLCELCGLTVHHGYVCNIMHACQQ